MRCARDGSGLGSFITLLSICRLDPRHTGVLIDIEDSHDTFINDETVIRVDTSGFSAGTR